MPQLPHGIDLANDEEMIDAGLFIRALSDANDQQKDWIAKFLADPEAKKPAKMVSLAFHPDKNPMQKEQYTRLFNFINNKNAAFYRVLRNVKRAIGTQKDAQAVREALLASPILSKYLREVKAEKDQVEQEFQKDQARWDAARERAQRELQEKQKPRDQEKRAPEQRRSQQPKEAPAPEKRGSTFEKDRKESQKQERKPSIPSMFEQEKRKSEEKPKQEAHSQDIGEKRKALNQILKNQTKAHYHSQKPTFAQKFWTYGVRGTQITFLDRLKFNLLYDSKLTTQQKAHLLNSAFNLISHDLALEKSERWTKSESRLQQAIDKERKTLHQQFPALKEKLGEQKILIEYIESRNIKPDQTILLKTLLDKVLHEDQRLNKKFKSKPKN